MSLASRIQSDLTAAMKARDTARTGALRMLVAAIKNARVAAGHTGEVTDEEVVELLGREAKRRAEAAEAYEQAGRTELAAKERRELEVIEEYLPEQLSEDEVRALVREIVEGGTTETGPVMGRLMPRIKGRFDGREANRIVREELEN